MGRMIYGDPHWSIEFDDRLLAHLRVVIIAKLRRDERFMLSWEHPAGKAGGHSSIWVHPAIPLQFAFDGGREPSLNRAWVDVLMDSANSSGGLLVLAEPSPLTAPRD